VGHEVKNIKINQQVILLFVCFSLISNVVLADVAPVQVTTLPGISIEIDLSSSISNIANPNVTVATAPELGTATKKAGTTLVIIYTPNDGVANQQDSFVYEVINDSGQPEQETVTVTIGDVATQGETPEQAISDTLDQVCLQDQQGALVDLCEAFNTATQSGLPEDLREFLDALSPKEIAAQSDLGNDMARQQVESVIKRLMALRKGMTQAALGNLAFNVDGKSFTWDQLRGETGGAASADQTRSGSLGWYLNGNFNFGGTKETDKEDAYNFNSGNLTTGLDYRFSRFAVLGGALGFGGTAMKIDNDGGSMDVSGATSTLYASFFPSQRFNIDIIQSYNYQEFSTSRRIIFGQTDATAESTTNSGLYMASLAFGYELVNARGFTWTTSLRGDYLKSTIQAYEETGNSSFNLSIEERTVEQVNTDLNNSLLFPISYKWGVWIHQLDVSWIHQFKDDAEVIRGSFVDDPSGTVFEFTTDPPDRDYAKLAYGQQFILAGGSTLYVQLQTTLAKKNYFDVGLAAGFRTEF
jgi:uncharacterized protein with beta-barrel porin domain